MGRADLIQQPLHPLGRIHHILRKPFQRDEYAPPLRLFGQFGDDRAKQLPIGFALIVRMTLVLILRIQGARFRRYRARAEIAGEPDLLLEAANAAQPDFLIRMNEIGVAAQRGNLHPAAGERFRDMIGETGAQLARARIDIGDAFKLRWVVRKP